MLSLSNFVAPYLSRERTNKETTRKKKYKKIKNRKQMTRIKIERLHLHHYFAIASLVDTPILEL